MTAKQIYVKLADDYEPLMIEVVDSNTVAFGKSKIQSLNGVPSQLQRLTFIDPHL